MFLCEVKPRTQLLIGLEFFQNKLFTESSRTYRRSILVFSSDEKKKPKTNSLFNHLNSSTASWLSWKLCDFGSRGTRFEFHRGQLFISVSLFFSQSEDSKKFQSLSHQQRWPPHMRASEVNKNLPAVPSYEGTMYTIISEREALRANKGWGE